MATELALRCGLCGGPAPTENMLEWVTAHGEETHDGKIPDLELVAICRCGTDMTFTATIKNKEVFDCAKCHRTYRR